SPQPARPPRSGLTARSGRRRRHIPPAAEKVVAAAEALPWEVRLAAAEASRAEYRAASRLLARSNAELLWRQRRLEKEAMAVQGGLARQGQEKAQEIEKLKKELVHLKQQAQEENKKLTDYYAQQIKELEEKFHEKVGEIGQIQSELKLIKEFRKEKAAMEKELEDLKKSMKISDRRHQEAIVRLEKRFLEEKVKVVIKALGFYFPLSRQLNSMGREVFKENIRLQGAFSDNLKEKMELQKTKLKLEEDKTLLLLEKETSEGLIRKKILQINHQKAQIRDLQCKVEKLEMAVSHMTREFETKTQKTQHQALIENQASMVEIKKLQQLLEMKDQEMNRVKKLARNILNERTEVERFFLDALEHVKQEIRASRKQYYEKARAAYYRKMMEACAGTEEFPQIKTFKGNINSTNSVYRDLEEAEKCYGWKDTQFEKVDISELTWEQKEHVLRLLFAKMNGYLPYAGCSQHKKPGSMI
uniref:Basal body-orientation factor 1 n=1 Tax=Anas zonorhyncha TaxID=75864 RepID=A0A8B9UBF0_9AVES